jgi:hypothetical protein
VDQWILDASRERRWLIVAVAIQVALVAGMLRTGGLFQHVGLDFLTTYTAADMIASGHASELYDTRAQWEHQLPLIQRYDVDWSDRVMQPFIAPPLPAVLAIPLLPFGPAGATALWALVNVACVLGGLLVLARSLGLERRVVVALVVGSLPFCYLLLLGQVEGLLVLAFAVFVREFRASRDMGAGLALALFAIKPPLLLAPLVYLLVVDRHRAFWATCAGVMAQAFVGAALVGPAGIRDYIDLSRRMAGPDGTTVTNVWGMVNLRALVVRSLPADHGLLIELSIGAAIVLALAAAVWLWRRAGEDAVGPLGLGLLATMTVLTAYHALYHTASIALLAGVLLLAHARRVGDELLEARVIVSCWAFFTLGPLLYFVVIQSSKLPAALSTIGILLLTGFAAQSILPQTAPAAEPAPVEVVIDPTSPWAD